MPPCSMLRWTKLQSGASGLFNFYMPSIAFSSIAPFFVFPFANFYINDDLQYKISAVLFSRDSFVSFGFCTWARAAERDIFQKRIPGGEAEVKPTSVAGASISFSLFLTIGEG